MSEHSFDQREYLKAWQEEHREYTREYSRAYRSANPEQVKASKKENYQKHAEDIKAKSKAYRDAHVEELKAKRKAAYLENAEIRKARARVWREAHPDYAATWDKAYYTTHREAVAKNSATRRTRATLSGGSYTEKQWYELKAIYNNTCLCCRRQEPEIILSADHIIPVSKGGTSYITNIQPLCLSCNRKKHAKIIDYRKEWTS
jgi:5-methylcytosine-specific restriction endonuclease McrA